MAPRGWPLAGENLQVVSLRHLWLWLKTVLAQKRLWYHFGLGATLILVYWGLACSLGVRVFDPWPFGRGSKVNFLKIPRCPLFWGANRRF